jgi:hypothetical protein
VDIVKGLEQKRQRRREKLLQKYAYRQGREKERRPVAGLGVERMRELGLNMIDKGKGAVAFGLPAPAEPAQWMMSI